MRLFSLKCKNKIATRNEFAFLFPLTCPGLSTGTYDLSFNLQKLAKCAHSPVGFARRHQDKWGGYWMDSRSHLLLLPLVRKQASCCPACHCMLSSCSRTKWRHEAGKSCAWYSCLKNGILRYHDMTLSRLLIKPLWFMTVSALNLMLHSRHIE
jgi:hypothetical protein